MKRSESASFMAAGTRLYFVANDGTNGAELWVSDGTSMGTQLVRNIGPTTTGGYVQPLRAFGNNLLFKANDGTANAELWMSDGAFAGTFRVTDVSQPGASWPSHFTTIPLTLGAAGETRNGTPDPDYVDGRAARIRSPGSAPATSSSATPAPTTTP